MRKWMGHTAVSTTKVSSVTLLVWQNGAKEKYCNFSTFNMLGDTKTSIIQTKPNYIKTLFVFFVKSILALQ